MLAKQIKAMSPLEAMDAIGGRVTPVANPCPSREEWEALRANLAEREQAIANALMAARYYTGGKLLNHPDSCNCYGCSALAKLSS